MRSNKLRMVPGPFLRPSDGSVDVKARAYPHRQITPRHLNDSRWRPRRSYVSSAARPAQLRHPPNPSLMLRLHSPSQYHPLSQKSRAGGNCPSGRALARQLLARHLALTAPVRIRHLALRMGLNPTSPTAPQLQPPPVLPLHPQSTLRARVGWHPELLSLSSPRRGASPTSTLSGRPLANSSSSTTSSNGRNLISSTNTSTSTFTMYSNQSMRSVSTFATSVSASSASSSTNWLNPQSPTFTSSSSLASSVYSNKGCQLQLQDNNNNSSNSLPRRPPPKVEVIARVLNVRYSQKNDLTTHHPFHPTFENQAFLPRLSPVTCI